jgi:hypothetical protein
MIFDVCFWGVKIIHLNGFGKILLLAVSFSVLRLQIVDQKHLAHLKCEV